MHCLQLLTQPSQCYLVLLTATGGLTFRGKQLAAQARLQPTDAAAISGAAATLQVFVLLTFDLHLIKMCLHGTQPHSIGVNSVLVCLSMCLPAS